MNDPRDRSHACAWTPRVGIWGLCVLLAVASIAVLWGHGTAEHTAALRWMQGYNLQKMNWKFRPGFHEHTGVSLKAHVPNNPRGGYTRVHQDTAQSRHRQRYA